MELDLAGGLWPIIAGSDGSEAVPAAAGCENERVVWRGGGWFAGTGR